jgi:hypothetical protein
MPQDSKRNNVSLLREYVKRMLEVKIMVGNDEFEVPEKIAEKIKASILKATSTGQTSPVEQGSKPTQKESEDYKKLLEGIAQIDPEVSQKLGDIVEGTKVLKEELKILLSKKDPQELVKALFKIQNVPDNARVDVPNPLQDVARLCTNPQAGGMQIGAGEIAIRLMFASTGDGEKSNSLYDVTISGRPWHVKAGSKTTGIKMGSAKGKLFVNTPFVLKLVRADLSEIGDLTEFGQKQFASMLVKWAAEFAKNGVQDLDTPKKVYDKINTEAVDAAMGSADGIAWYEGNSLYFAKKDIISVVAVTQGRSVVAVEGKQKIMSLVNSPPVEKIKKEKTK